MEKLPNVNPGRFAAEKFVQAHMSELVCDEVASSPSIRGGQSTADLALGKLDIE